MKYYLIAGEASGELHAAHLMRELKKKDDKAEFRFIGGDLMLAQGGTMLRHYKEIAYMGFVPVLLHLNVILKARKQCKEDIVDWKPDVVILVDYAGFNLNIARFVHSLNFGGGTRPAIHYYIAPKIWAWKEWRIKVFKAYVDEMLCILPFEKDFFEVKHGYKIHYVGNPTAGEVAEFKGNYHETKEEFAKKNSLDSRPIIALLAGSRKQEIKDNLKMMIAVSKKHPEYQPVLACAPSVEKEFYSKYLQGSGIKTVDHQTYALLSHATAALVTSGTATLETCCFGVPQIVLYKTPLPRIIRFIWNNFFPIKYISLVNLIAGKEVVAELFADKFTEKDISTEFESILPDGKKHRRLLEGYAEVARRLGTANAAENAASTVFGIMNKGKR